MILWSEDFLKRLNSLLMHVITVGRAEIDSTWGGFVTSEFRGALVNSFSQAVIGILCLQGAHIATNVPIEWITCISI